VEIEYLKNRRLSQRVDDGNVMVYYRSIGNGAPPYDFNGQNSLREKIFSDKILKLDAVLKQRGLRYDRIIENINAKANKLIDLVNSFADPEMKIAELSDVNLSASGIRFRTRHGFEQGARVGLLLIFLPRVDLIDCKCEVVRRFAGADEYGEYYDVATRYIVLDDEDKHKIVNYVKLIIESGPF
jgi:hypothetical protein